MGRAEQNASGQNARQKNQNGDFPMLSVNTNMGALIALQNLNATQAQLNTTQAAINTGMKVATAKDDGATYAIAQSMRASVAGYAAVTYTLNRCFSSTDVA
jgi:flagellin